FQASTTGQFISLVLVQAAMLAIIYWFVRRRNITLREIGLGRGPKGSDFGYALLCFVGYFIALAIAFTAVEKFLPSINLEQEQQLGFESASGTVSLVMIFVSLVVLPPIVEEIMIRGFLYSGLRRKLTKITAALVASVLFGVAHLQFASGAPLLYVAAIDTFVLSMVLVALREKTGSLWSGMIVHAMKNGLAFLALFVLNVR
ncbi:MAG: CPBP family intramembrane glutamic endopeptidase, partial [Candidatus Saccharimonadales bacterium]